MEKEASSHITGDHDPGPTDPDSGQENDWTDVKDQLEHQQKLISQFKEMMKKSENTNVTQEKVDRYASTLSKMTNRAKKSKLKKGNTSASSSISSETKLSDSSVNQKMNLLRQQVEETKAKLAERGKNQKGIEEKVTQLKAQFDDSFQLIQDTSINYSLDTKIDYSRDNTSDELYNILLGKEKRISDLMMRVQKLEGNVLDLQENLKEKDCVIDARTKAITLMTESLTKKGKNTLDSLEDTKEQMKRMQENFVTLENEMKARQMKLLDDLKLKNLEISELRESNDSLLKQIKEKIDDKTNEHLLAQIDELNKRNIELTNNAEELMKNNELLQLKLEEILKNQLDTDNIEKQELRNIIAERDEFIKSFTEKENNDSDGNSEQVTKLKKQLEELNKSLIKIKAEHKTKVKTLNKKIDAFKKISDVNAHVVKLEEENTKLNEKIVELEAEKGNLQLQLMESKEATNPELGESSALDLSKQLELQSLEIAKLQGENKQLQEKNSCISQLKNEQVASEIDSIHYEELSEKLNKQIHELEQANQTILSEKQALLENIKELNHEKQDLQNKLDNYIHENIELVDKLEKLSAEKVSSAESIEIVENLTQQEKLELEVFQQTLDVESGKLKISEENSEISQEVDLNDSVNQVNEEAAELLQRIELFTIERREVMEKMECLANENNQLNAKLKELENNHEILKETSEKLRIEKSDLNNKILELQKENEILQQGNKDAYLDELSLKINDLEIKYSETKEENSKISDEIKQKIIANDQLLSDLKNANGLIESLELKLSENVDVIENYKTVIEENKEELINSANLINKFQESLNSKDIELEQCQKTISNLNNTIEGLNQQIKIEDNLNQSENTNLENLMTQLNDLKLTLNDHLEQINDYEKELQENSITISNLNLELKHLSQKILENESLLIVKNEEINHLNGELSQKNYTIQTLNEQIQSKDEIFHKVTNELKTKIQGIQRQTESTSDSLENIKVPMDKKIEELTTKNHNLVEKMKKLAANLKKKTQIHQELEQEYNEFKEKWKMEKSEKENEIANIKQQYQNLLLQNEKYENNRVENISLVQSVENRNEVSLHEELSGDAFTQEVLNVSKTSTDSNSYSKILELEMIIETLRNDIENYRDRISHLEEDLSHVHERKESLEKKTNELGAELQEKSQSLEEICQNEDMLEQKLKDITHQRDDIEKELEYTVQDVKELTTEKERLLNLLKEFEQKYNVAQEKLKNLLVSEESYITELREAEEEINNLKMQIKKLESEKAQLVETNEQNLEKLESEKYEVSSLIQNLQQNLKEVSEKEQKLLEEINSLKIQHQKLSEDRARTENELTEAYKHIEHLKMLILEKDREIESYLGKITNFDQLCNENMELKNKLTETFNELYSIKELLKSIEEKTEILQKEKSELIDELNKYKEQNKDTFIQENITESKISDVFKWPESPNPFDFIIEPTENIQHVENLQQPSKSVGEEIKNTNEELLQKIKTLEFMLKYVENERDDVLSQCATLSNEISSLLYQKQNKVDMFTETNDPISKDDIDYSNQQPISEVAFVKKEAYLLYPDEGNKTFQEFSTQTDLILDNLIPVNEPLCVKKEAYLLYPDAQESIQVESQVLSSDYFKETDETRKELQNFEFSATKDYVMSDVPVIDEMTKKAAYLCHQPENLHLEVDTFGENDDGWGFSAEETKVEMQHVKEQENSFLSSKVADLEKEIQNLRLEKQNADKEFKDMQVKSSKLIKKLKELKAKNEQLTKGKQNDDDMFNLDNAIQEELKTQIEQLEKRIVEIKNELGKEKSEKTNLQKRVDVLTSAHERLVEMKEKQDVELIVWQRRADELKSQLNQFEWGEEDTQEQTKREIKDSDKASMEDIVQMKNTIKELNDTIKELTLDNEDLQSLLEEQRNLRIQMEKAKSVEPLKENMINESDYLKVTTEKNHLEKCIEIEMEERKKLQNELNEIIKKNDEQLIEFNLMQKNKMELENLLEEKETIINQLQQNLQDAEIKNAYINEYNRQINDNNLYIQELEEKVKTLVNNKTLDNNLSEIESLREENLMLKIQLKEHTDSLNDINNDKEKLTKELNDTNIKAENLEMQLQEQKEKLCEELTTQRNTIEYLIEENRKLNEYKLESEKAVENLNQEILNKDHTFQNHLAQLEQQWQNLVDQRGNDVAESWKLHLESRENEFIELENQLKKDIKELEEKYNILVNENNELRKNVDAEIKNEVDRISALQQHINENQQYIQELTKAANDKQKEIKELQNQYEPLQSSITSLQNVIEEKNTRINELQIVIKTTQKQFNEKQAMLEAVVQKLEYRSNGPILFILSNIMEELERQIDTGEKDKDIINLTNQLAEKDARIIEKENQLELKSNELLSISKSLTFKEEEINSLQSHLQNLKIQIADNENLIANLKVKLESNEQTVLELRQQIEQLQTVEKNENENVQSLQQSLVQCHHQIEDLQKILTEKEYALEYASINQKLMIEQKEKELNEEKLKQIEEIQNKYLEEIDVLSREKEEILQKMVQENEQNNITQNECRNQIEDLFAEKQAVVNSLTLLQNQMAEQQKDMKELMEKLKSYENLNSTLETKILEFENIQDILNNKETLLLQQNEEITELKALFEDQVAKIEELKEKLYEKSNDYDSLIAEMDMRKEPRHDVSTSGSEKAFVTTNLDDPNDWVSRSELDIALYMLHQRDVRCEELTVELTHLLKERDTLQLRLSNSLRENEQLKKTGIEEGKIDSNLPIEEPKLMQGTTEELNIPSTSKANVPTSKNELDNKLSELYGISYQKDKTLVDEQEQRRLQQLSIMHQHIEEASRLPPEAAARLVDARYTLSRDVQSPSKVLLNWLWGKSTPKVNDL